MCTNPCCMLIDYLCCRSCKESLDEIWSSALISATFWNLSTVTALLTPAWPTALQPSNIDIRAIQRGLENVLAASIEALSTRSPKRTTQDVPSKQAAAATLHPEQRLIPLDCACSFGSVIPLSAVRSKKAFSVPGAP